MDNNCTSPGPRMMSAVQEAFSGASGKSHLGGLEFNTPYINQILIVAAALCIVAAAAVALLVVRQVGGGRWRWRRRPGTPPAGEGDEDDPALTSESAPVTRSHSYARLAKKFASSERLDRVRLVSEGPPPEVGPSSTPVSIDGAELRFRTKLDLLDGLLYLHSVSLRFRAAPELRLDGWRAVVDIRYATGAEEAASATGGCQQWRLEANLTRNVGARDLWWTDAIDYVVSLRMQHHSRLLPHERCLLVSAFAVRSSPATPAQTIRLGQVRFPVHLANEPGMSFSLTLTGELLTWQEPAGRCPRLHLGLLYTPGATVSRISVRLVEVFDVAEADEPVVAAISLLPGQPGAPAAATVEARPAGPGAFVFPGTAAGEVVLAIDNSRLQSTAGVAISLGRIGRLRLGDFSRASGPAMRQWNAALTQPNCWLWLTHACGR